MIRKLIYNTTALLLIVSMVACEGFFEKDPYDSTKKEDIIENEKDAQTLLYGMYAGFMSSASYGTYLSVLMDIMTDASLASAGFTNQMGEMYAWRLNPGTSEVGSVWGNHYASIYNTNYIINHVDSIEGNAANLDRIKGEALAGRALLHYNLVRLFGKAYNAETASTDRGVPYVTSNEIDSPTRHSVADVYKYIVEDLEEAELLIPPADDEIYNTLPIPRETIFTKDFVRGLLARVALDMKDYNGAIAYASMLIESNDYALEEGLSFINMWLNDTGSEIIWKVGYTPTDYGAALGYNFYNRNRFDYAPMPDYIPAEWWVNSFNPSIDVRYTAYINYTQTGFGWAGHLVYKYPTNPAFNAQQGLNMPKPMRLAEMYLIRAEANAYLDNDELAQDDISALLEKRIIDHNRVTLTGDELKEFILNERKRELMFEGFYWFDLKRHNKGFTRVPQANTSTAYDLSIAADDYRWQWPIPTSEINGNDNIKQNEGY
ncbi:RagB/SusD family nutrient uptake outer membrane protein [Carboxylicivirga sediminis]|uniref:RagB/SusD family nutrient uptake outer membrane protein n=1 Tax=Carboxylicivirga sediminis TaxID=2006564 RepID=A0A941F4T4_9BACT|nr:RagB/SusD family nutrient uptake outer membrane protein [Carboxylicivirga sediminis]MBR8536402.1 RagB/SusD family nutrient uptake outer membrane protein [Carboxylicivirga sediminis]